MPTEDGAIIEGLFVRALKASGALADGLRAVGIDVDRLEARYDAQVFLAGLDVAARVLYPAQATADAHVVLGQRFVQGFLETVLGKVVGVATSLGGPERVLQRLPKGFMRGRPDITLTSTETTPRRWVMRFLGTQLSGPFCHGVIDAILRRTGISPTVQHRPVTGGFELHVSW